MKRFVTVLLALIFVLSFAGCSGNDAAGSAPSESNVPASVPAAPTAAPGQSAPVQTESATPMPSEEVKETPAPSDDGGNVEADWTMQVDDTIKQKVDGGMEIIYNLVLVADKKGGTDDTGTYTGTAHLTMSLDASKLSQDVIKVMGGFNVDVSTNSLTFDVVGYDVGKYAEYGATDELGLAPLVKYDSMALFTTAMTGTGSLDVLVKGIQGEKGQVNESKDGTSPILMKMVIDGGQVTINIPSLNLGDGFDGMVTGTPK